MKTLARVLASALFVASATSAAQAATVINGSFEDSTIDPGSYTTLSGGDSTTLPGWTVILNSVDLVGDYWEAADGNQSIDLGGTAQGGIFQDIVLTAGRPYVITFDGAANIDGPNDLRSMTFSAGSLNEMFSFDGSGQTHSDMGWQTFTSQAFLGTGGSTRISFISAHAGSTAQFGFALDNVRIDMVPEPATWGMMLLGFGLLGSTIRRRRSQLSRVFA